MYFRMEKVVGVGGGEEGGRGGKGGKSPPAPRPKPPGNDNLMWHHLSIIQASFRHHSGIIPNNKQYDVIPPMIHFLPCAANTISH